ncbi:heterokaryon incompatibility protein [Fusarium langsethiae]|uniref:Heterokaryon incompatibility protein n=1 Tax=Fusarium langsethiae TaxID=179993 RepID=A0A0M9ELI9_FUSLA|nr:heterokaryon incompatibility protein [Fusarium langsethiae]
MFSYKTIGGALGSMRICLLHLLPATDIKDPIESRLEVVALEQNPVYEALSYCWGDTTELLKIKCNDQEFQVTENLFSALQHLRHEIYKRTLWIDAICINQKDLEERQSQVLLMKDIYTRSKRVVVWLGPDPAFDGINHLFDLIQTIPDLPSPHFSRKETTFFEMNIADADQWSQGEVHKVSAEGPFREDFVLPKQAKKSAVALLERPWWTTVWTLQEMVLAPSAIFERWSLRPDSRNQANL